MVRSGKLKAAPPPGNWQPEKPTREAASQTQIISVNPLLAKGFFTDAGRGKCGTKNKVAD